MGKFLAVASFYNNTEAHIDRTFENVLNQTHQDWILIVGDDFSQDEEFKRKLKRRVEELNDKRVLYYPVQFKRELYLYQNTFQHFEYDYFFDLDSDDIIDPRTFEIYDQHFKDYPEVMSIFSDSHQFTEEGHLEQWSIVKPSQDYLSEFQFRHKGEFWQIYQERDAQKMYGCGRAMRRPEVSALPILEKCKTATDTYFLFYNLTRGKHLHIPRRLYTYIRRPGSDSGRMSQEEHEKFNLNASQFMETAQLHGSLDIYQDVWHVTSAISTAEWIDRVKEFSVISKELTDTQRDKIRQLYPDKQIFFNEANKNTVVAWAGELPETQLQALKNCTKLSVLCFNEDFEEIATEEGFMHFSAKMTQEVSKYVTEHVTYTFFRQIRFTVDDGLDELNVKPRKVIILVDSIESSEKANEYVRNIIEINSAGSEAHLIEINPTIHQHYLHKMLGTSYFIPAQSNLADSMRNRIEELQPDIIYRDGVGNVLADSTNYWLENNYWKLIQSKTVNGVISDVCMYTPLAENPKLRFYYRNGPELHCDTCATENWEAHFYVKDELKWRHKIYPGLWARHAEEWYQNWECRIIEKNSGRLAYTLKPDCTQLGIQMDSGSLGDTLSWMGQVEEVLQQRDHTKLYVRCHKPWLFDKEHYLRLNIEMVNWNEAWPQNWQALGVYQEAENVSPYTKHPRDWRTIPLGAIAADQLGIFYVERKPRLAPRFYARDLVESETKPSVCIGPRGTAGAKEWQREGGWQSLIDMFKEQDWTVHYCSVEDTDLMNIERVSNGDKDSLIKVAQQMGQSGLFIGIGSGLSWLAWAVDARVCLISGFSYDWVEFDADVRIINKNVCHGCWTWSVFDRADWNWCPQLKNTKRHFECTKTISPEYIWQELETAGWFNI